MNEIFRKKPKRKSRKKVFRLKVIIIYYVGILEHIIIKWTSCIDITQPNGSSVYYADHNIRKLTPFSSTHSRNCVQSIRRPKAEKSYATAKTSNRFYWMLAPSPFLLVHINKLSGGKKHWFVWRDKNAGQEKEAAEIHSIKMY